MKKLAPIVLFVYNRFDHTKITIESLLQNDLAKDSDLIIYSDFAKDSGINLLKEIEKVRDYIKRVEGFKSIKIIERSTNFGLARSVREGVSEVLEDFESVIVLEDDLVMSPYFLSFMNQCLSFYENDQAAFTVSGYSKVKMNNKYKEDVYFSHISNSWGWATWRNRWERISWDDEFFFDILNNRYKLSEFKRKVGNHRTEMLKRQLEGEINSWAILRLFNQLALRCFTVFPSQTLVRNIGHDGTGVHSGHDLSFDQNNKLSDKSTFNLIPCKESPYVNRQIYKISNVSFMDKIMRRIKSILRGID
jgi:hypothetical protein